MIFSLLRAESSCGESVITYRTEEMRDDLVEELCMAKNLEPRLIHFYLIFVVGGKELQKTD